MHFHHADFIARVLDASFKIGFLCGDTCRVEIAAIPRIMLTFETIGDRQLHGLHSDDIVLAQCLGDFGCGDDSRRRTVRHAAAVEQAKWFGNHRRIHHLFFGDGFLQMGLRVQRAIGVALHRHMRDGAFQVFLRHIVLGARRW